MTIILRFIIRNIREKKLRTFLILFSITLSTGLFFASTAISGTLEEMYGNRMRKTFGSADILIHANEKSPSRFLTTGPAQAYKGYFTYMIGGMDGRGTYRPRREESLSIGLRGFDWEELQQMNPVQLVEDFDKSSFIHKAILISSVTAEKYKLHIGDSMEIHIGEQRHRFEVVAIAQPTGPFLEDGRTTTAYIPKDTLAALNQGRGKATTLFIKLKNPSELEARIEELSKVYSRYTVREPLTLEEIKKYTRQIAIPFMMMTTMVLLMSIFIIYTCFKVIAMERLPTIGTFRSIGATRKMTNWVLVGESIGYGLLGGVIGCGFGVFVLAAMTYLLSENPWSGIRIRTPIQFTGGQLLMAFLLALILSVGSSLLPIIKISKLPIKDVVLNKIQRTEEKKNHSLWLGLLFLLLTLAVPRIALSQGVLIFSLISLILLVVAVILLVPPMTLAFILGFEGLYTYLFGNEGLLAVKNIRDNRHITNNIALLSIGISSLLMINTISFSVITELVNFYREATFEIWMWTPQGDRNLDRLLQTVEGVREVYGILGVEDVEISHRKDSIQLLQGVDSNQYGNYWNVGLDRGTLQQLDQNRRILLTYTLKDKFGLQRGDWLPLETEKGKKDYQVIGFFHSLRWAGNYALISERYLKSDMGARYYDDIYIKTTGDPEEVQKSIQKKFERRQPWVKTIGQIEESGKKSSEQLFRILRGFSIMTMVIGIVGILNNLVISFIERKRILAILRSIGMSKKQIIKMLFVEALTGGLIGGILGVCSGILMISIVPYVMKAMGVPIPIHYPLTLFIQGILGGVGITLIASVSPALKSSKLDIIEAIKLE